MAKIYTKTGDLGETSLIGGLRVKKNDCRISAYGTLDELNSHIGLAIEWMKEKPSIWIEHLIPEFEQIQNELFNLGSQMACESEEIRPNLPQVTASMIARIESQIDKMQTNLPTLKDFILPGGTLIAAQVHICRTVSRRAERELLTMYGTETPPAIYIQYLNRLSDYFFVTSRFVNFNLNSPDVLWRKD